MSSAQPLLSAPNFSEGRNERVVDALAGTLGEHARLINTHFDAQHNRSVFTLCGRPAQLTAAVIAGAEQALELIDLRGYVGLHPHVGALDVSPLVWIRDDQRQEARTAALAAAKGIAALGIPVFLYGELAASEERRERAFFRRGGPAELARRMTSGELEPDLGPDRPHPSAGATLVTSRPPLVAFNLELDTPNPEIARAVAEQLRESGGGLPGVRALGLPWEGETAQVSINIHDSTAVPLARVVEEVRRLAAQHGARPVAAELVGLVPAAAMVGYPDEPAIGGFDPDEHVIERVLATGPG
ncbi:MAG: glutamate formiminotransferase [Actinomycetota bacterium]|nr:glutamate formiminotransferase [Actinomycetota bacterium]